MTTNTHHDLGELYSAYSAGTLDPAFALLVETQAALRSDVAEETVIGEAIAGEVFDTEETAELSDGLLARTFEMIDAQRVSDMAHKRAAAAGRQLLDEVTRLPVPVFEPVIDAISENGWVTPTAGVRRLDLDVSSEAEVEIYRIEPGRSVPRHSHDGMEFTLVMTGGFTDETGAYGPGDLSVKGPNDTHQPTADADGVCYTLAVRDGAVRLTGMLGVLQRLLQR
ncbi:MAG: ChrR family anti-sigma-E factor [Pseudomonadota bacterium]